MVWQETASQRLSLLPCLKPLLHPSMAWLIISNLQGTPICFVVIALAAPCYLSVGCLLPIWAHILSA
jgi:hypothetical protein